MLLQYCIDWTKGAEISDPAAGSRSTLDNEMMDPADPHLDQIHRLGIRPDLDTSSLILSSPVYLIT